MKYLNSTKVTSFYEALASILFNEDDIQSCRIVKDETEPSAIIRPDDLVCNAVWILQAVEATLLNLHVDRYRCQVVHIFPDS